MVFKIIRAGKKVAEIGRSLENDIEFSNYLKNRKEQGRKSPLQDDMEILNKYMDYVRFSRPASLLHDAPSLVEKEVAEPMLRMGKTSLPFAFVSELVASPERWSGHHVIIDGELEHVNTNRNGEHWHRFMDPTGTVIAVSKETFEHSKGTLFGVARHTSVGKQLFLEIKNFHPVNG